MSRNTVLWKRKYGSTWAEEKNRNKVHSSQAGGNADHIFPGTHVKGTGRWLEHGGGVGRTVTLPMHPEKEQRIRSQLNGKSTRRRI